MLRGVGIRVFKACMLKPVWTVVMVQAVRSGSRAVNDIMREVKEKKVSRITTRFLAYSH